MVTNGDSPQPKDDRVISILSNMNNQSKFKKSRTVRQKVADLVANQEVKRLELVVLRRYPRRLVDSANYTGSLAAACGRDETGIV